MNKCKLVGITVPKIDGIETAEQFIAYAARISNPTNQSNIKTADKLIRYLIKNKHWSPFEMAHMTISIETTRDIARQILRHRSFAFQEFSTRYAEVTNFTTRETRLQDLKNRQNSILTEDEELINDWEVRQEFLTDLVKTYYHWALDNGIAKEQARVILPEGLTVSTLYMSGSIRSWIHYCDLRMKNGTQKEHIDIANQCWEILRDNFPNICIALEEINEGED